MCETEEVTVGIKMRLESGRWWSNVLCLVINENAEFPQRHPMKDSAGKYSVVLLTAKLQGEGSTILKIQHPRTPERTVKPAKLTNPCSQDTSRTLQRKKSSYAQARADPVLSARPPPPSPRHATPRPWPRPPRHSPALPSSAAPGWSSVSSAQGDFSSSCAALCRPGASRYPPPRCAQTSPTPAAPTQALGRGREAERRGRGRCRLSPAAAGGGGGGGAGGPRDMAASVFCCLRCCRDGGTGHIPLKEMPAVQLDTQHMGTDVVIVKNGRRICGTGGCLASAPLHQNKSYFEFKIQSTGIWGIGVATQKVNLNQIPLGRDVHSLVMRNDGALYHNNEEKNRLPANSLPQEGDVVGITYDHVELNVYLNGKNMHCPASGIRGTVYPVVYVDDSAILDCQFSEFYHTPPPGFEKILFEQQIF